MKKNIFLFVMMIAADSVFSQQSNPSITLTKQDYMIKSKHQITAAWILLGGGIGLVIIGGISSLHNNISIGWGSDRDNMNKSNAGGEVMAVTGGLAMLGSIPLFIAASKNKRKAMSLSFTNEKTLLVQSHSLVYKAIPSLSIKIGL